MTDEDRLQISVARRPRRQTKESFWRKVDRSGGLGGCWPWIRAVDGNGRGVVRVGGLVAQRRIARAHRVAWELTYGPIPLGLVVRHDCDNPICCNPSHLRLGTQADNIRDAITRNRHVPPPVGLRGRRNEEKLQISVIKYLRVSLPSEAVFFHCPNGGSRHLIEAMKFKRLGVMPGIPDILIIYKGRLIAIELKGPKGRISPDQFDMHMRLTMAGAVVNVCRSLEDVQGFLATILPMKGRLAA